MSHSRTLNSLVVASANTIGFGSNTKLNIPISASLPKLWKQPFCFVVPMLDLQDFQAGESVLCQCADNCVTVNPGHMDLFYRDNRQCEDFPVIGVINLQEVQCSD